MAVVWQLGLGSMLFDTLRNGLPNFDDFKSDSGLDLRRLHDDFGGQRPHGLHTNSTAPAVITTEEAAAEKEQRLS